MKICIWTTSFQADTLAFALAVDSDPSIELLVITSNKNALLSEPIAKVRPINCVIMDRARDDFEPEIRKFKPDIVFADNHIPPFEIHDKFVYHWHGVPLKIRPAKDLRAFHRHLGRLIGDTRKPNPRLLAQCYGRVDYEHRLNAWHLPAENCRVWGSAYSDLLLNPPYEKEDLQEHFELDLVNRKTILLSITWHFGDKVFSVLGDDDQIFKSIVDTANELDANIIFSLHDRYRYSTAFINRIQKYANQCNHAFVKYKSDHVDNLADLIASDVMICSFSSFIIFHYFTGKPSIHILPIDEKKTFFSMPTMKKKKVQSIWRLNNKSLWMYPFSENGGLVPADGDELIADLKKGLADPAYGRDRADFFIKDRVHQVDGHTCARMIADMKEWIQG